MIPEKRLSVRSFGSLVMRSIGVVAVVVASTAAATSAGASDASPIRAIGAENEYANVIEQVGGRFVTVQAILSNPNTDPHTFEANPSVARAVASAQLIVQNGVGYDTFMQELESASPSGDRKVISAQALLGLPTDTKNPHLWYKPATMPFVAKAVERDLVAIDPSHAAYFEQRLASFQRSLAPVTKAIAQFRARYQGVKVATTEPVADYLLSALGLVNKTPFPFQADIMNGVDPSPEDIAFQQRLFRQHVVKVFCYNAQVISPVTISLLALAKSTHVPVVAVYETMPTPGYDFQSWMLAEIHALTRAVTAHVSTTKL